MPAVRLRAIFDAAMARRAAATANDPACARGRCCRNESADGRSAFGKLRIFVEVVARSDDLDNVFGHDVDRGPEYASANCPAGR